MLNDQEQLESQVQELTRLFEEQYPQRVGELAQLLHCSPALIQHAMEYTCRELRVEKYPLINHILMFHRVIARKEA